MSERIAALAAQLWKTRITDTPAAIEKQLRDFAAALQPEALSDDQQQWLEQNGRVQPEPMASFEEWFRRELGHIPNDLAATPNTRHWLLKAWRAAVEPGREQIVAEIIEKCVAIIESDASGLSSRPPLVNVPVLVERLRALSPFPNFLALKVAEAELRSYNDYVKANLIHHDARWVDVIGLPELVCKSDCGACQYRTNLERRVLELGGTLE